MEFASFKFQENYRFAVMKPVPEFKPKTENDRRQVPEMVTIPALAPTLERGLKEDRSLCPIRALRIYKERTAELRNGKPIRKLFMSHRKGFEHDICKNTFAGWVRKLIKEAYKKSTTHTINLSGARPHEVRALAASMAWQSNLRLADILEACTWRKHTTFTHHYLRDISMIQDELHSLGPLVAAQSVIRL